MYVCVYAIVHNTFVQLSVLLESYAVLDIQYQIKLIHAFSCLHIMINYNGYDGVFIIGKLLRAALSQQSTVFISQKLQSRYCKGNVWQLLTECGRTS